MTKYKQARLDEVSTKYHELKSNKAVVAALPGETTSSVFKILKKLNLSGLYTPKELPFDTLPDKIKGYLCGLWSSDGNLSNNIECVSITLQERDKKTLSFIAEVLAEPKLPISAHSKAGQGLNTQNHWSVRFCHHSFYNYMVQMGITPAKSLTLDVKLDDKSDEFKWYFLRGAIDGDGCIHFKKSKEDKLEGLSIELVSGSEKYINYLQTVFGGNTYKSNNTVKLSFFSNKAKQLAELLPTDSFTMSRKTEKIIKAKTLVNKVYKYKRPESLQGSIYKSVSSQYTPTVAELEIVNMINGGMTISAISRLKKMSRSTINTILKRVEISG